MTERTKLVVFDTETTSDQPSSTHVCQLAALSVDIQTGEVVELVNTLCNPGIDISEGATKVHGITNEMVKDEESDQVVLGRLYDFMDMNKDDIILSGHNILGFDMPILWRRAGKPALRVPYIDTLICATRTLPEQDNHKLGNLIVNLGLGSGEGAHDAMADIRMVHELVKYFSDGLRMAVGDMATWCSRGRALVRAHFGKHKGKKWGRVPKGENSSEYVPFWYAKWASENWDDFTPDMAATLQYHYGIKVNPLKIIGAIA